MFPHGPLNGIMNWCFPRRGAPRPSADSGNSEGGRALARGGEGQRLLPSPARRVPSTHSAHICAPGPAPAVFGECETGNWCHRANIHSCRLPSQSKPRFALARLAPRSIPSRNDGNVCEVEKQTNNGLPDVCNTSPATRSSQQQLMLTVHFQARLGEAAKPSLGPSTPIPTKPHLQVPRLEHFRGGGCSWSRSGVFAPASLRVGELNPAFSLLAAWHYPWEMMRILEASWCPTAHSLLLAGTLGGAQAGPWLELYSRFPKGLRPAGVPGAVPCPGLFPVHGCALSMALPFPWLFPVLGCSLSVAVPCPGLCPVHGCSFFPFPSLFPARAVSKPCRAEVAAENKPSQGLYIECCSGRRYRSLISDK